MNDGIGNQLPVKGRQYPTVSGSQCQQIAIRYLR